MSRVAIVTDSAADLTPGIAMTRAMNSSHIAPSRPCTGRFSAEFRDGVRSGSVASTRRVSTPVETGVDRAQVVKRPHEQDSAAEQDHR